MASSEAPIVGVIMGSKSDWEYMSAAAEVMEELKVPHEVRILSAHRTPEQTLEYSASASARGLKVIIAGAGGAAHLAGVVAAKTIVPVIGGDDGDWEAGCGQCGSLCGADYRARRREAG